MVGMLDFDVVDVFGDRPFTGNQLAVVHGADGLDDRQLLDIAREFNYSETTFPGAVDERGYAVRIFTPGGEIPFAGHPTLGTAWVLRLRGLLPATDEVVQRCGAGEITVRFGQRRVELDAVPRDLAGPLAEPVAHALLADVGLTPADLAGPVWLAGTGLTFVHLPVRRDAVARAHPSVRPLSAYAADLPDCADPTDGINLHSVDASGETVQVHSRVFVPGLDVAEDPAVRLLVAGQVHAVARGSIRMP
jgi:trans-2,3-dihydro-3-hydroxyanthranilate isomerase